MVGMRPKSLVAFFFLLVAACGTALAAFNVATVVTDMPDYYPGDNVVISGTGWQAGETVSLTITQTSPATAEPPTVLEAIADSLGTITNSDFRVLENHLGAEFSLVAEGLSSGERAETTFTDSPLITTVSLSGQTPNPVQAGSIANYDFTVNRAPGARNFDVNLTVTGLPSGVTFTFSPSSINFGGGSGSRTVNLKLTVGSGIASGTYPFTATATVATNSADTSSAAGTLVVQNDGNPPVTIATPDFAPNSFGWNNTNVIVALSATDGPGESGVKEIVYSSSGAQSIASTTVPGSTANVTFSTEGISTLSYHAVDNAGNIEATKTLTIQIDKTAPTLTEGTTSGLAGNSGWYRSDVSVAFTADDPISGLESAGDASFNLTTSLEGASVPTDSRVVRDKAGNESTAGPLTFKVDKTAPSLTQGTTTGTAGNNGWYRSDVSIAFTASDGTSGLALAGDAAFSLEASGEGSAVATGSRVVEDVAGNSSTAGPLEFKIDKTNPVLTEGSPTGTPGYNGWYWSPVSVPWTALDAVSGLASAGDASFDLTTTTEGPGVSTGSRTVYDAAGNSSEAEARTFHVDLADPDITATPDRAPNANGWYTAPVEITFDATDSGSGVVSVTDPVTYSGPDSDAALVPGSAEDASGRIATTSFNLKYDSTLPIILITGLDMSCLQEAHIDVSATDTYLDSVVITLNGAPKPYGSTIDVTDEGEYELIVTAKDLAGNTTVETRTFEIDLSAPVVLFGSDWPEESVYYNAPKTLEFSLEDPEDVFTKRELHRSLAVGDSAVTLNSGDVVSTEGRYTIDLVADDCAGNITTVLRTFFIDLTDPNTQIEPIGTPGDNGWFVGPSLQATLSAIDPLIRAAAPPLDEILGSGVASIRYDATGATTIADITENIALQTITLEEGITSVQLRSTDVAGNESEPQIVQFRYDKTAPEIGAISDIVVEATGPDGATVDLPEPVTSDNLSTVSVEESHVDGGVFPLGETTVTVTAIDEAGNLSQETYKVTVQDTTPPTIPAITDVVEEATGPDGAIVNFTLPTPTDLVDPSPTISASPTSGSQFALGETTVTVTAKDFSGNEATRTFKVTVQDTTPPTLSLPADITIEGNTLGGAIVSFTATANDIVDGPVAVSCTPASGSTFGLGETTVDCSATDAAGNTANGSFKVTVVDTTPPTIDGTPTDMVVEATGPSGASVNFAYPTATDIVDGSVTVNRSHNSGDTFPLGETTVTFSATDASTNTSTTSFKITVRDTTAPTLSLPADITQTATSALGNVVSFTGTATDIVDGDVPVICTPPSESVFPLGTTIVNCTATDNAGNVATGSFTVSIIVSWSGLLPPVTTHGDKAFKLGSTIPVKFLLTGASAGITDLPARLYLTKLSDTPGAVEIEASSTSAATTGNLFRYTDGQYIFNLGTKGLSVGRWLLRIDFGDGVLRTVEISLR